MRTGTNDTIVFQLPFSAALVKDMSITFVQKGETLFVKDIEDITIDVTKNTATVQLSVDETNEFSDRWVVETQLKVTYTDDTVGKSRIMEIYVEPSII